ncbi:hypothetical protein CA13_42090 [Planctomycetes bacterium CA13]|uniref:Prepilin-type N-terminal cleavage/methylation domain-containing protein n=1 Tax=Novipirellula herctigrandis TaxID=2527986 RepID=A0A5C5Z6M1_9BACT|nr:hypothetical protein CA13_42090 [Planctomycetes bacterium CA13]
MNDRQIGRYGYSLIELMVVISVSAVLMTITVGWIIGAMKHASTMRDRSRCHQSMLQLARDFRDDVHSASSAKLPAPNTLVMKQNDSESITYRFRSSDSVERQVAKNDRLTHRQQYWLAPDYLVQWSVLDLGDEVGMVITSKPKQAYFLGSKTAELSQFEDTSAAPSALFVKAQLGRFKQMVKDLK